MWYACLAISRRSLFVLLIKIRAQVENPIWVFGVDKGRFAVPLCPCIPMHDKRLFTLLAGSVDLTCEPDWQHVRMASHQRYMLQASHLVTFMLADTTSTQLINFLFISLF